MRFFQGDRIRLGGIQLLGVDGRYRLERFSLQGNARGVLAPARHHLDTTFEVNGKWKLLMTEIIGWMEPWVMGINAAVFYMELRFCSECL